MIKMKSHNQSFFGQSTGIVFQSSSKAEPHIFIRCIKKKRDGSWEKYSLGEGKTIKCSLEEIVMMRQVLEGKIPSWSIYHSYKDTNTQIQFNWENGNSEVLWIRIGDYAKMLAAPQIEILKALLEHLFKEKIEFATGGNYDNVEKSPKISQDFSSPINESPKPQYHQQTQPQTSMQPGNETFYNNGNTIIKEEIIHNSPSKQNNNNNQSTSSQNLDKEVETVTGMLKRETKKALLIEFRGEKEIWIPKSVIRSPIHSQLDTMQELTVESWILRKNQIPV